MAAHPAPARKTIAERTAPLTKEIARRRTGTPLTPGDVHEQIASLVDELVRQGMTPAQAGGLVNRAAAKALGA
ncbi:hypothetical protein LEP48_03055 [Isoptericola sp. NEAU-Y5]|uniref:Uncharacterized protein n=1 Tax=Isoptericola luteus TaxID=2879484 RepID=A0ABS7ZFF5_9MICO|nr:hypothetical protein [Isoptericola sp. NEAU-Y5]MCA5892329.1 hypothetical protein [Isoptericola sp. NEAU-Y5]